MCVWCNSDDVARWVKRRVSDTEKNMAAFKESINQYLVQQSSTSLAHFPHRPRRTAYPVWHASHFFYMHMTELRAKSLKMAAVLKGFSDRETRNIKATLGNLSEAFEAIESHRKILVERMEIRAKQPLSLYKIICKGVKVHPTRQRHYTYTAIVPCGIVMTACVCVCVCT